MMLTTMLTNISSQLRISPISTSANIVQWLTQSIKDVCTRAKFLETFTIIPAKASVSRYFLPGDHLATTGVMFDGANVSRINVFDVEFVSPTVPTFYYEDEWEDEASENKVCEFATHYTLNELWPLQLMRSQQSAGTKSMTLVSAPTADGVAASSPIVGMLDGTVDDGDLVWRDTAGVIVSALSSEKNIMLFYKYMDVLPVDPYTDVSYNDLLALLYNSGTLGLALSTEDDEYDRYRSYIYTFIMTSVADMLGSISINRENL